MKSIIKEIPNKITKYLLSKADVEDIKYSRFKIIEKEGEFVIRIKWFQWLCSSELRGLAKKLDEINKSHKK